jgi:hypothetical protein
MAPTPTGESGEAQQSKSAAADSQIPSASIVADVLNEHGYPFQYTVLGRIMSRFQPGRGSPWQFVASELPVSANDVDARIDFVLKHHSDTRYVVAECKRANPAYSSWCFFRAPYVVPPDRGSANHVLAQRWIYQGANDSLSFAVIAGEIPIAYQIAIPLKRREKGDSGGQPKKEIDDALTQVARGMTGLIRLFEQNPASAGERSVADVFGVLFTTARLFVSDPFISRADILTGNIDEKELQLREVPWLVYQYHASISVQYAGRTPVIPTSVDRVLTDEALRTVFIVSASAVDSFLVDLDTYRVP